MGLDIYVGSLTRYYCGDWETVIAQAAREQGIGFKLIRSNPEPPDKLTDPVAIGQAVEGWRSSLEAGLRQHLTDGLAWDESADADYFTDKPDWFGYSGVVLLAAHTVCPEHPPPERATAHFDKDRAFETLANQDFRCPFSQIFEVEVWLPCLFSFTFRAPDVSGKEVGFGSSITLLEQLRRLNNESYRADAETLARWEYDGAGSQDSFEQTARFGLAMFLHYAQLATGHRLPMKLDY